MRYRLIVANTTFEIGEQLSEQPFKLFLYDELGITSLMDWSNLMQIHLYEDRIRLRKIDNYFKSDGPPFHQLSVSDIIAYASRGYQILNKEKGITELYRPPSGVIKDENDKIYTQEQMIHIIKSGSKGYTTVKCYYA